MVSQQINSLLDHKYTRSNLCCKLLMSQKAWRTGLTPIINPLKPIIKLTLNKTSRSSNNLYAYS